MLVSSPDHVLYDEKITVDIAQQMFSIEESIKHTHDVAMPAPTVQRDIISNILNTVKISPHGGLKIGDSWFVVASEWFNKWLEFVNSNTIGSPPPAIDNSSILHSMDAVNADMNHDLLILTSTQLKCGGCLRPGIVEGKDYILLPYEAWFHLFTWYKGAPVLRREVITVFSGKSATDRVPIVDLYPELREAAACQEKIEENKLKLSNLCSHCNKHPENALRCGGCKEAKYCNKDCQAKHWGAHREECKRKKASKLGIEGGSCGLSNLGNTCFMNSIIQCMSHTWPLRNYFITDKWTKDVNKQNVLGTKGMLAQRYL